MVSEGDPGVAAAIERAGDLVWPLPPDVNPIEPMWSKVKEVPRSLGARTGEALPDAIGAA
jgi:hypothetical protein